MRRFFICFLLAVIVSHGTMAQKLLKTVDWGMTDETNKYCPEGKVTGTAAVAMSIVMNYHQWPLQGTGSHSYYDSKSNTDHSVDFESTSFDWNAMPGSITDCTEAQADVMADLFYKCAVAANSYFHSSKTYTFCPELSQALIGYFRYMPTTRTKDYSQIKEDDFALLKKEIDEGRPVIGLVNFEDSYYYCHAFVVDGYKGNQFHINWCRNGEGNGYYSLNSLDNSGLSFSNSPWFVIGISPNKTDVLYSPAWQRGQYTNDYDLISTHNHIRAGVPFYVRQPGIEFYGHGEDDIEMRAALVDSKFKVRELLSEYTFDNKCEILECTSTVDAAEGDLLCFVAKEKNDKYWKIVNTCYDNAVWNLPATGYEPPYVSLTTGIPEGVTYQPLSDKYLYNGNPVLRFEHQFTIQVPDGTALQQTKIVEGENTLNLSPDKIDGNSYSYTYAFNSATAVSLVVKKYGADELVDDYLMELTPDYSVEDALAQPGFNPDVITGLTLSGLNDLWGNLDLLKKTIVNLRKLDMSNCENSYTVESYLTVLPYLEELVFPKEYSSIYNRGYDYYNPRLMKITLPQKVSFIYNGFFVNMSGLTDIYAPFESMPSTVENSFEGVNYETVTLHVPKGWKDTFSQHAAFGKFKNIVEDIIVGLGDFEVDGIYYNLVGTNAVKVAKAPEGQEYEGDIVIPSSITYKDKNYTVTKVGHEAFMENTSVKSVEIPATVASLEDYTFYNCTALESVKLPEALEEVPEGLFYGCTSLTKVNFPESLVFIGPVSFMYTALKEAILPDGIETIGERAFYKTSSLEKLHLPANLFIVADQAFVTWSEVVRVDSNVLPESLMMVGTAAFYGLVDWNGTHSIVLPKDLCFIDNGAFAFCKLDNVSVSEGNEYFCIQDNMLFNNDKSRLLIMFNDGNTKKVVPEGVTEIDMGCGGCDSSVEQLVLPSTLENIGYFAFLECFNLKDITVNAPVPPLCSERDGYYPFNNSFTTATLHVPAGSTDAYREAETWKNFQIISDISTSIDGVSADSASNKERIYNLKGQEIKSPKGLYIKGGKVRVNK